jgi:hypothetical protein
VLATEHLLGLAGIDLLGELVERARKIVDHRFAGLDPFGEDGKVVDPPLQRLAEIEILLEPSAALQQLLRRLLILPEVRLTDSCFYACEFVCGAGGVKDSSASPSRAA